MLSCTAEQFEVALISNHSNQTVGENFVDGLTAMDLAHDTIVEKRDSQSG